MVAKCQLPIKKAYNIISHTSSLDLYNLKLNRSVLSAVKVIFKGKRSFHQARNKSCVDRSTIRPPIFAIIIPTLF